MSEEKAEERVCSWWVEKEIGHISDDAVTVPQYTAGTFETLVPGAVAPMRVRKMYTRLLELSAQMQVIFAGNGLVLGEGEAQLVLFIPPEVRDLISPIQGRAAALEAAMCAELMAEFDLWKYISVLVGKDWAVFTRTDVQEQAFYESLLGMGMMNDIEMDEGGGGENGASPNGFFLQLDDPRLN